MSISLYDAFVPSCLQLLGSASGLIDKAQAHCTAQGWEPEKIINARLAPDMQDFAYQVKSCHTHSVLAIEGIRAGVFSPEKSDPPKDFAGLKAKIATAIQALEAIDPVEFETLADKQVEFRAGDFVIPFTVPNFLLSFTQPNFYFHLTTTYAILRNLGVEIGKRDYMGALRVKPKA